MQKIQNKFFDVLLLGLSFFVSVFRSINIFLFAKKGNKKGVFLRMLDFVLRIWPSHFWKKPTGFKLGIFFSSLIKYLFYK